MLAVPILLGVAASGPNPRHLLLAVAAAAAYLATATAQAWRRSRRPDERFAPSLAIYAAIAAAAALPLVLSAPAILVAAVVVVPALGLALVGARPGSGRDLADSLSQVAVALVLVPVAARLGERADGASGLVGQSGEPVTVAVGVAVAYLVGTVLVVRSVIRERDNRSFAVLAAGWHAGATAIATLLLPLPWSALGLALTARAVAMPIVRRRRASTRRPLRPVAIGMIELVAAVLVVLVAFATPLALDGPLVPGR